MRKLISEVIERYNKAEVRIFLDSMKDVGFKFGTKAGLTVAINDVKTPPKKDSILKKYEDLALKKALEKDCNPEIELLLTHEETELWASYSKTDSTLLCLYTCVNNVCMFSTEKD